MPVNKSVLCRTLLVWKRVVPALLLFEICYRLLSAFVFQPVFSLLADYTLGNSGIELAFNERIVGAFASPLGLLGSILLGLLAMLSIYYEFSVLFLKASCALDNEQGPSLPTILKLAVPTLRSLKSWSSAGFAIYALGLLPLVDLGLSSALLPSLRIPNFITGELSKTVPGQAAVAVFYTIAVFLFLFLLFTLPHMCLGAERFSRAFRHSWSDLKKSGWKAKGLCAAYFFLWSFLFHWPGVIPSRFVGITRAGLPELITNLLDGKLLSSLPAFLLSELLRIVLSLFLISLLTVLYHQLGGSCTLNTSALPAISEKLDRTRHAVGSVWHKVTNWFKGVWKTFSKRPFFQKHKKLLTAAAVFLGISFIAGVFAAPPVLHAPIAIGHRGSLEGVENTLESVQGAIDAGADYAEIDILLSKDSIPMVIHDTNLSRLTGDSRNVYELTAAELKELTLSQNGRKGQISTLQEMLAYCRGKINLLIELKTHGHETVDIALQVAEAVEDSDAESFCMFMSLDYNLVEALRELRPGFTIGYCVYGSITDVDTSSLLQNGVDFLTIEENMVSPRLVNRCLHVGLPVYVWTVDDYDNMNLYLKENVSGLISDYPDVAKLAVQDYWGDTASDYYRWQKEWIEY